MQCCWQDQIKYVIPDKRGIPISTTVTHGDEQLGKQDVRAGSRPQEMPQDSRAQASGLLSIAEKTVNAYFK